MIYWMQCGKSTGMKELQSRIKCQVSMYKKRLKVMPIGWYKFQWFVLNECSGTQHRRA